MNIFIVRCQWPFIFFIIFLCISCTRIRPIKSVDFSELNPKVCLQPFFITPYRFIHTIEAELPGGSQMMLIGITVIDPVVGKYRSAIMTIEGMVLFDASCDNTVFIYRALPPFDNKHFANSMMDDVQFIYFPPQGTLRTFGNLDDGSTICRYYGEDTKIVDVILHPDHSWEIEQYSSYRKIVRKVKAMSIQDRIPSVIELSVQRSQKYFLRMKLISAEPVPSGEIF